MYASGEYMMQIIEMINEVMKNTVYPISKSGQQVLKF